LAEIQKLAGSFEFESLDREHALFASHGSRDSVQLRRVLRVKRVAEGKERERQE
jgi:hypothetical protein